MTDCKQCVYYDEEQEIKIYGHCCSIGIIKDNCGNYKKLIPLYPMLCPVCGKSTKVVRSDSGTLNVMCGNSACEGKLANRIDHYLGKRGLDVKGISMATIEKLINWGWVEEISDMYHLHEHQMEWIEKPGFGKASVFKMLDAIDKSLVDVDLAAFISALGVPLIGKAVAKEITKYYDTWNDFRAAVGGDWTQFNGFGPEMSDSINGFDYEEADRIAGTMTFKQPAVQSSDSQTAVAAFQDKTFCITGKLMNYTRDSIKSEIESLGGKVVGSISSKVDYLLTNTPDSGTQKNKDAQRLGISIITEDEYLNMKG